MKPLLLLTMGLLIPSIVGRIAPARAFASERNREPQTERQVASRRSGILCLLSPFQHRKRGWMLAAEGGLLDDERLQIRSAWKGEELEVEYSGGERGVWGNTLCLTFRVADPNRPAVEAKYSWFSDVGPLSATVEDLTGEVFVVPLDGTGDPWARVKQGWNGRTRVQVAFELHGRHKGDPICVHGVFDLEPGVPEGR